MKDDARDIERMMALHGGIAAGGLGLYLAARHVIGLRTLAALLFFATPLSVPVLVLTFPLLLVGGTAFLMVLRLSILHARRAPPGLALAGASVLTLLLLVGALFRLPPAPPLSLHGADGVVWGWAALELLVVGWWFRRPAR